MPLFGRKEPETVPATTTSHRHSREVVNDAPPKRSSTLFSRNRNESVNSVPANNTTNGHSHNLLHRNTEDASITNARERVLSAEAAERDADRALLTARAAVKEAREHVKRLEREAAEEARLAKIKMKQAGDLGKRGKMLGRHDHIWVD